MLSGWVAGVWSVLAETTSYIMILLCQGAGGLWTGLGWATPVGGHALIRSHGPPKGLGGVDRSLSGQRCCYLVSRLMGSDHTQVSGRQVFEGLAGHVTFQTPHDLGSVQSFVSTTGHVDAGLLMAGHAGEDDPVEGGVGLTITSPVQPVSSHLS